MMPSLSSARVDFHLHSWASNVTDYYAANAFSIPESYSDPLKLYRMLRQRGMDLVTLTDHNSIDGAKAMLDAGLERVFLSAEMTTRFPEDGCHIHVTIANVTETQFAECKRLRGNVYEMLAWLDGEIAAEANAANRLAYFMTHPLMSTQNRPYGRDGALRVEHLERMLVVCNAFEVQNGARTRALNALTHDMLRAVTPATIERLADKHGLTPKGPTPWLKAVLGGSDDHAGINPGRTWTEFPTETAVPTANGLVDAIRRRQTAPGGIHGGPITLAHALLKLLHDGGEREPTQGGRARAPAFGGPIRSLMRLVFATNDESVLDRTMLRLRWWWSSVVVSIRRAAGGSLTFEDVLREQMNALVADVALRRALAEASGTDDRIFLVIGSLANRLFQTYAAEIRGAARGSVIEAIKAAVALVSSNAFLALPYLISFLQQSSDSLIARDVRRTFSIATPQRLVLMTDTFFEVNGVTGTLRRMLREAERRGIDLTVVSCVAEGQLAAVQADREVAAWMAAGRLKLFPAVVCLDFPEYDELQVRIPPLLDVLRYLQEGGFTKMQISTPGTVGVTGLFAAKLLQIETSATYHTSFPEYVENYTRDVSLEALAWNYMIGFYHTVDEVIVPSKYIARLLHKRGLRNRKLLILDRWVDTVRFHPRHRDLAVWAEHGVPTDPDVVRFIYVGRLGLEKNLELIARAFREVHAENPRTHLVLVGDGPYRRALTELLAGLPVTFTGYLAGEALVRTLASADVKLFPSTTDTWGNAPLEAQACGVPVIVSSVGGPCELMVDGQTGLVVSGRDVGGLRDAMLTLLDPTVRVTMARNARAFTEAHVVPQPFSAILDAEAYRASIKDDSHPSRAVVHLPEAGDTAASVSGLA